MEGLFRTSIEDFEPALDKIIEYNSCDEGEHVQGMISYLNDVATKLCDFYDKTYCSRQKNKYFSFQCENSVDQTIATMLNDG
jgi:hypothetical protein